MGYEMTTPPETDFTKDFQVNTRQDELTFNDTAPTSSVFYVGSASSKWKW